MSNSSNNELPTFYKIFLGISKATIESIGSLTYVEIWKKRLMSVVWSGLSAKLIRY